MVKKKKTGTLIILSGPSGAGKGTICAQLLRFQLTCLYL